jgi:hypothetical protein
VVADNTYDVDLAVTSAPNGGSVVVSPSSGTATIRMAQVPDFMPVSIPRSQKYFWSRTWQEGERESTAERDAGRAHSFDSANALIHWLLTPED